jgi:hypothetical protein
MGIARLLLTVLLFLFLQTVSAQNMFIVEKGKIKFTSDAPMELIQAKADKVEGILNSQDLSFAFRVKMKDFKGFNSSLQRTHFNENYLETNKYPYTIFKGKIIEDISLYSPGDYKIRGKGSFICHGVERERIIKTKMKVKPNQIEIKSSFTVLLEDHNIKIPSVVSQKLSDEIFVDVEMTLKPKQ